MFRQAQRKGEYLCVAEMQTLGKITRKHPRGQIEGWSEEGTGKRSMDWELCEKRANKGLLT